MEIITVLVIEDNPADSLLVREYIQENVRVTSKVIEAESLKRALELIPHYDFDVILLDLQLPDSSGLDTVRQLITHVPKTAVIILTGLEDDRLARQAIRYGAQDLLYKKHLSPETLVKSIRYSLERQQLIQEKDNLLQSLDHALKRIKQLEDLLPFCINCKKILANDQHWQSFEDYLKSIAPRKSQKKICPECRKDLEGL